MAADSAPRQGAARPAARGRNAARPAPGAWWDGAGTAFTLQAGHADAVELCLFERPDGRVEAQRITLEKKTGSLFSAYLPGAGPGTFYGYRVHGPFAPQEGHRFNSSKLLVDPYALALTGEPRLDPSIFGYRPGEHPDFSYNGANSAGAMPKAVVVDREFDWQGVSRPRVPWRDTVIYEAHLAGLTRRHPELPEEQRGKYLGLASPPLIEHLKRLGVTTVELMPLCQFASETHLLSRGRTNYWGYNPLAFLAPHAAYATGAGGEQVRELKTMVRELHRHGLEVVVDMVFNHSAEGNAGGPTLSFKGIDNRGYYKLDARRRQRYLDYTGCGNTLDIGRPACRELVLAALRYWAGELGVDGFRLDLATTLGRDHLAFDPQGRFFAAIAADPLLADLKWIAEPWDVGPHGYRLGAFPAGWAEWNDRYRDTLRRFWRGDGGGQLTGELARRLTGSGDLFLSRAPLASVNFVTCHDGFTLADLVAYSGKHNEANGEDNRDGANENWSANWGAEGPSADAALLARRRKARANLLASLFLSQGVPMLSHGDELGRSQGGNNNAYNQDNPTTWVDWEGGDRDFLRQVRELAALRRRHAQLRRGDLWTAETLRFFGLRGEPLGPREWSSPDHVAFGFVLDPPADGPGDGLLVLINGGRGAVNFRLPAGAAGHRVTLLVYTPWPVTPHSSAIGLADWTVEGLAMAVFAIGRAAAEEP